LDSNVPADLKPSPSAKSKNTRAASSQSTGHTSPNTTTCEPSQPTLWPETELPLTLSAVGSRARTLALLDEAPGLRESVPAYGENIPVSLASLDPVSSSWRTSQHCLVEGLETFSETWPRSGTMRNGIAYLLPPLVPLTDVTDYGLLPTPCAQEGGYNRSPGKNSKIRPTLKSMARHNLWPTPTIHGNYNRKGASKTSGDGLATAVKLWPTPTRVTNTGGAALCKWGGAGSRAKLSTMVTPEELNGALNPTWVEALMGFPFGYTDVSEGE